MKTKFSRWILSASILTLAISVRAALPPAENLLPSDTLLLLSVPDCATLRATMHQSPQWLLWNDPAMKPFHDKFMAKWNEQFVTPLQNDLGIKLSDFEDLPQGQLTFAVTQNGWNGNDDNKKPGIILLLDAKDKSDLLKTNLAALRKKWTATGKNVYTETISGIPFSIVPLNSNNIPPALAGLLPKSQPVQELGKPTTPAAPAGELVVGQFQSLLIVSTSTKSAQAVATRLTGGALPPLSDNPLFAADKLSQFRDSPLYFGWFNTKVFFDVLSHIPPPEPNPDAPSPMPQIPWDKVLNASGLTGLKTATFVYRETREGEQLDSSLAAPEASRQGILKMIAALPKDANPPTFVPATAIKFWRWRMDGQNSWNTLQKMLGDISPTYLSWLNSILDIANASAQQQDPNFDVRKNFLGNLGDDWISYQTAPNGTSLAALSDPPSIFLFAVSNPDQTVLAIKNIAALSARGSDSPVRDFLGKKIYTIPLPRRTIGTNTSVTQSLYFCASSGYIAVTTDNSILEAFLRSAQSPVKPLREIPGLADAAQRVGGAGNGLFGYQNQREAMRSAFSILKTTGSDASGLPFAGGAGKGLREWFDFSLLPDFDAVSKYFNFSVYAGNVTTDGIYFKFFAPRPPQLN
ncbi:MAG TPA: hypothetical protein VHG89_05120 [Verrucomicrobiae bacterium]|nr:hypothetical protein [Verrucomicrobiae bacterium]